MKSLTSRKGLITEEAVVTILVAAVLAAVLIPKFMNSSSEQPGIAIDTGLELVREAIGEFRTDTGLYPAELADLVSSAAPRMGLTESGELKHLRSERWRGPYLEALPGDASGAAAFVYVTQPPRVGSVAPAVGADAQKRSSSRA